MARPPPTSPPAGGASPSTSTPCSPPKPASTPSSRPSYSSGKVRKGDILFCLRGSLGKFAVVSAIDDAAIASSLVIVRVADEELLPYALEYFSSPLISTLITRFDNGTAQPNLAANDLAKFLLPLPPLREQRRIVAKVDELMVLCDQLAARLKAASELAAHYASAATEAALETA